MREQMCIRLILPLKASQLYSYIKLVDSFAAETHHWSLNQSYRAKNKLSYSTDHIQKKGNKKKL